MLIDARQNILHRNIEICEKNNVKEMSDYDTSQALDSTASTSTREFIGPCVGILAVVLVILVVAVCKWSHCLYIKQNHDNHDQTEPLATAIQPNTLTSYPQHHRSRNERVSSDNHSRSAPRHNNTTRNGLLAPPQEPCNGYLLHNVKAPHITITTLSVQPSQQLVPRLSISPQSSNSSNTRPIYSIRQ